MCACIFELNVAIQNLNLTSVTSTTNEAESLIYDNYDCDPIDPTCDPTSDTEYDPTSDPTNFPTIDPTSDTEYDPTLYPTNDPTSDTEYDPTCYPTYDPTCDPTSDPTVDPTNHPTIEPTSDPTNLPSIDPTFYRTYDRTTEYPTKSPTSYPMRDPTSNPTSDRAFGPTKNPIFNPTRPTDCSYVPKKDRHCDITMPNGYVYDFRILSDYVFTLTEKSYIWPTEYQYNITFCRDNCLYDARKCSTPASITQYETKDYPNSNPACFNIGYWNNVKNLDGQEINDQEHGKRGFCFTLNGDYCDKSLEKRTSKYTLLCDENVEKMEIANVREYPICKYSFTFRTKYACKSIQEKMKQAKKTIRPKKKVSL